MAVTKGNGFPFGAQPAGLRFVSIARSVPRRVAHPPPQFRQAEDVCLDATYQPSDLRPLRRRKDV